MGSQSWAALCCTLYKERDIPIIFPPKDAGLQARKMRTCSFLFFFFFFSGCSANLALKRSTVPLLLLLLLLTGSTADPPQLELKREKILLQFHHFTPRALFTLKRMDRSGRIDRKSQPVRNVTLRLLLPRSPLALSNTTLSSFPHNV